jgi:hypothetical protein
MTRTCAVTGEQFDISQAELEYCRKNGVPLPTISFRERLRQLLAFRNRGYLYNGTCEYSKKKILTCVPPEGGFNVYDVEIWHSEKWDPQQYRRSYDFSRPFFEQFAELFRSVPYPNLALVLPTMENSDYTNGITGAKNCYLLFTSSFNEDCMFSYSLWRSRNVVDCVFVQDSELCYECLNVRNCYNLKFSQHCLDCSDSAFLFQCHSCSSCYSCANMSHKQYCFRNEQLSKSEYEKKLHALDLGSRKTLEQEKERFLDFARPFPVKFCFGKDNLNCTGNHIRNNKNCINVSFVSNSEDVVDSIYLDQAKSSIMHAMFGNNSELIYNCVTAGDNVYNLRFCAECWQGSHDLEYCITCCYGSSYCFGCVGLKKASYCVFNKEYSKQDYLSLVDQIKAQMKHNGEYGVFFPSSIAPFYYNQSDAICYLPTDRSTAIARNFRWKDEEPPEDKTGYMPPDHINDVGEAILGQTLVCPQSKKSFKIIKPEFEFYKRCGLPIPVVAPLERIRTKLGFFEVRPVAQDQCSKCGQSFLTAYNPLKRPILCERCFQNTLLA